MAWPCQVPKTARSRSAARAARSVPILSGPTAMVALRSRIRPADASVPSTAQYGVQATGAYRVRERAPTPATGAAAPKATENSSPSWVGWNSQPNTA